MTERVADIRKDYILQTLLEEDVDKNPFNQFAKWWNEALISRIEEVNAMTLATAAPDGAPSARIVLLKGFSEEGFVFFTNYLSKKGREISQNPKAALVFFWKELERQIRVEGYVEMVSSEESDAYFYSRPRASRIGAWASQQSGPVAGRSVLEEDYSKLSESFKNEDIPRPPHWGGYIVKPNTFEFWQGRSSRLHDRIQYTLAGGSWQIQRLAP